MQTAYGVPRKLRRAGVDRKTCADLNPAPIAGPPELAEDLSESQAGAMQSPLRKTARPLGQRTQRVWPARRGRRGEFAAPGFPRLGVRATPAQCGPAARGWPRPPAAPCVPRRERVLTPPEMIHDMRRRPPSAVSWRSLQPAFPNWPIRWLAGGYPRLGPTPPRPRRRPRRRRGSGRRGRGSGPRAPRSFRPGRPPAPRS